MHGYPAEGDLRIHEHAFREHPALLHPYPFGSRHRAHRSTGPAGFGLLEGPRSGDPDGATHRLEFWSPFGTFNGPVFQLANDRLVVATGQRSLALGVELAGSAATWVTPGWALVDGPPDEIAVVRMNALARIVVTGSARSVVPTSRLDVVAEFLAGTVQ